MSSDTVDKLVVFLAKRDGIDKLVKTFQYVSKLACWRVEATRPDAAERFKKWEVASGLSRKAFRTGRSLTGLNTLRRNPGATPLIRFLAVLANSGEMVYFFFDHFLWLSRIAVGSVMASRKLMEGDVMGPFGVLMPAIATAFALSSSVYISWNISGGHVNPAVTFGMAVAGRINVPTAMFYWTSQMIASVMACLVLKVTVVEQHVPIYKIAGEMTGFGASVLEGVLTFILVYTVFSASDPRRGQPLTVGPIMIGLVAGANVLAAGPFSGGSMNPACAFGSAMVYSSFKNQAVYWVGPLLGGAIAALVYDNVVIPIEHDSGSSTGDVTGV